MYSGVSAGWDFELRGLNHYLEHHRGPDRTVATARRPFTPDRATAWERLAGPGGWLERTGLRGAVLLNAPPVQVVTTVDQYNNGLLRIEVEAGHHATAWLAAYGVPRERIEGLGRDWQQSLAVALA